MCLCGYPVSAPHRVTDPGEKSQEAPVVSGIPLSPTWWRQALISGLQELGSDSLTEATEYKVGILRFTRSPVTTHLTPQEGVHSGHRALEWGVWRTISYFSLKIDCLEFFSFFIWYILTIKLFHTQFYKILLVYQGLKLLNILFYREKTWFLVQNPWLRAIANVQIFMYIQV